MSQYLAEAKAADEAWEGLIGAHVAMTPSGSYRDVLAKQRNEARRRSQSVDRRLRTLGGSRSGGLLGGTLSVFGGIARQLTSAAQAPLAVVRGSGGEDKLVQNLIDETAVLQRVATTYRVLGEMRPPWTIRPVLSWPAKPPTNNPGGSPTFKTTCPG